MEEERRNQYPDRSDRQAREEGGRAFTMPVNTPVPITNRAATKGRKEKGPTSAGGAGRNVAETRRRNWQ